MSKLSEKDHDTVKKALNTYERMTGEPASGLINQIEVANPEKDTAAEAARKDAAYKSQAELQAAVEATEQAQRRAAAAAVANPDNMQPQNPGGDQEAMATERAKAAGAKPASPPTAAPHR